jgi:hypothetical protein
MDKIWNYSFLFLVGQLVLMLIAGWGGVYLNEYFRTRGKHLATQADFESLKKQLQQNTELVETIKSEVSQKDWAKREWTNLRRLTIDDLLNTTHDCADYLKRFSMAALREEPFNDRDPHYTIPTAYNLYLPELTKVGGAYVNAFLKIKQLCNDLQYEIRVNTTKGQSDQTKAHDRFRSAYRRAYDELLNAQKALNAEASKLLREIVGVAD